MGTYGIHYGPHYQVATPVPPNTGGGMGLGAWPYFLFDKLRHKDPRQFGYGIAMASIHLTVHTTKSDTNPLDVIVSKKQEIQFPIHVTVSALRTRNLVLLQEIIGIRLKRMAYAIPLQIHRLGRLDSKLRLAVSKAGKRVGHLNVIVESHGKQETTLDAKIRSKTDKILELASDEPLDLSNMDLTEEQKTALRLAMED